MLGSPIRKSLDHSLRTDELYRFHQPVGKQYTYGKGMKQLSEVEQLRLQVELLKKYQSLVRESKK